MYINDIELKNFKCFVDLKLNFSKLTLITGANSSGKSSLLNSILGTIQSNNFPKYFSPNGKYVDMGDYKQIVHMHKVDKNITINISLINNKIITHYNTEWEIDTRQRLPKLKESKIQNDYLNSNLMKIDNNYKLNIKYNKDKDPHKYNSELFTQLTSIVDAINYVEINDIKKKALKSFESEDYKINLKIKQLNDIENIITNNYKFDFIISGILQTSFNSFNQFNNLTNYISSFRYQPERTYYQKVGLTKRVNRFGEGYIDQILEWELTHDPKLNELITILRKLKIASNIRSKRLAGGRFELLVKIPKSTVECSLNDVGFGISQFLPIIVADIQLPKNSTLILSQPEIHLHPSVQADLSDYIVDSLSHGKRYIIETHSEYILNRIRYLIVKKKLNEKDIKITFFKNINNKTDKYDINFLANGKIENAPKDFFTTYLMDSMSIALEAKI